MVRRSKNVNNNIKFLCSYGGKIILRDGVLRYVGGHTRLLSVPRSISYAELMVKLVEHSGCSIRLKCQLPKGDLETLVSIKSDEDLAAIIREYDAVSSSSLQIRAILSPPKSIKFVSPPPSNSSSVAGNFPSPPPVKYGYPKIESPRAMPVASHWNGYPQIGSPGAMTSTAPHWHGYPQIGSPIGSPGAMPTAPPLHRYPQIGRPAAKPTTPHWHCYPQIGSPAAVHVVPHWDRRVRN